jgi:ketosteroid isomerase-like protein
MKPVLFAILLLSLTLFAPAKTTKPVEQILIQLEHDWSDADVKKDVSALNRILADDWIGIDFEGTVMTKPEVLRQVSARNDETATESTVLGEMKVRIFGNMALVTGKETEKSRYKGEDSSGEYIWTDFFVLRNGRWQAVSSQSTRITTP